MLGFSAVSSFRSLIRALVLLSILFACGATAVAAPNNVESQKALEKFTQGDTNGAKDILLKAMAASTGDVRTRQSYLDLLFEICSYSYDEGCLDQNMKNYVDADSALIKENPKLGFPLAYRLGLYAGFVSFIRAPHEVWRRDVLGKWIGIENEVPADVEFYMRRQALEGFMHSDLNDRAAALRSADKLLSLIASVQNPQDYRIAIASSLSDAIELLLDLGEVDRAWGIYQVTGDAVARNLPAASVPAMIFRAREADLLDQMGDINGAKRALDLSIEAATAAHIDPGTKSWLLANGYMRRAAFCLLLGDRDCVNQSIKSHPFAKRADVVATPDNPAMVQYLAVRTLIRQVDGVKPDEPLAEALLKTPEFPELSLRDARLNKVLQWEAIALATDKPDLSRDRLAAAARELVQIYADIPPVAPGAWYRISATDEIMIQIALIASSASSVPDEITFRLLQLLARKGNLTDADNLTAILSARNEDERRTIHQALRLNAKRNQLELRQLYDVAAKLSSPFTGKLLKYDPAARRPLNDYAKDLAARQQQLLADHVGSQSVPVVGLKELQDRLAPNEVALSFTRYLDKVVYICVRHDSARLKSLPQDVNTTIADIKFLQLALSDGRPPNEELDSQYPVPAAVRLYQVLLQPFAGCLKEEDHLLWLEAHGELPIPLTALLSAAPPKLGDGYDLSKADWVLNHYTVSYSGTAALVVANRNPATVRTIAANAFLGVGDPDLSGAAADGSPKQDILARGALRGGNNGLGLQPLPETKVELESSARYFPVKKILVQDSATEGDVRREVLSSYGLFSFATHGLIRQEIKGLTEPALVLTPVTGDDASNDGLLTASEIADLELPADFVALSACNTANYDLSLMSRDLPALASAFSTAGVAATMGTLWAVDSTASQTIVAGTFRRLGEDRKIGPAEALAKSQRAFLSNPPRKAMVHPRFWAPFMVLGDSRAPPEEKSRSALRLDHVEKLTNGGGEILGTLRDRDRLYATFIGEKKGSRYAESLRAVGPTGEVWRTRDWKVGADDALFKLGPNLLAGGYEYEADTRKTYSILKLIDPKTGATLSTWSGRSLSPDGSVIVGSVNYNGKVLILLGPSATVIGKAATIKVLEVNDRLEVKPLFEFTALYPRLSRVKLLPATKGLLIVESSDFEEPLFKIPKDDFDFVFCNLPSTTIERRDWTGRQVQAKQLSGLSVEALAETNGNVFIGGSIRKQCADQAHAVILKVNDQLQTDSFFLESQLGQTSVKKLVPNGAGGLIAAVQRENVLGFSKVKTDAQGKVVPASSDFGLRFSNDTLTSGEVWIFDAKGAPLHRTDISSGSDIYLHTIDRLKRDEILVGGSIGGEAVFLNFKIDGKSG